MQYRRLGTTDIDVSVICLGTMTFGQQNSEADAHAQLDYALDAGVNFIDTAELYAFPARSQTYGDSEQMIGRWLRKRAKRDAIVLASKIAGPGEGWIDHIRGGKSRFDRANLEAALDGSLRRLQTDYLDLYQLHWPERETNFFGRLGYTHSDAPFTPIEDTLGVLSELIHAGKIRHVGLSNETPWGVMKFLQVAERMGLPRVVSVQNPYSLLNRTYEIGLAEVSMRERCGLLAYSPLGFGVLSGKYLGGARVPEARLTLFPEYRRYSNARAVSATERYVQLAHAHGLDPAQMALAYVNTRPFLTSTIIGATTMDQLRNNIASVDLRLTPAVIEAIETIHAEDANPSP